MKIYIMTDCEGVAGVLDFKNWCSVDSRYYDVTKELLTLEVNAAIAGFAAAGVKEFLVCDGHGSGAINPLLLDERAELLRGLLNGYPYELDKSFDAIAWVGQHAMSRTPQAHLAHTGSWHTFEHTVNDIPVGEFGELAMCASELGVRAIFGSGDRAFCAEAQALVPGIETVEVKRGTKLGRGDECNTEQYSVRNRGAIHMHPVRVRERIRIGAERAVKRFRKEKFGIIPLRGPFVMVKKTRALGDRPPVTLKGSHPTSVIAMFQNISINPLVVKSARKRPVKKTTAKRKPAAVKRAKSGK
ncbi:MAG: M55 family metallopeptidase [Kiritimatiellia bacterium]|jgi:D-aminopeptidase